MHNHFRNIAIGSLLTIFHQFTAPTVPLRRLYPPVQQPPQPAQSLLTFQIAGQTYNSTSGISQILHKDGRHNDFLASKTMMPDAPTPNYNEFLTKVRMELHLEPQTTSPTGEALSNLLTRVNEFVNRKIRFVEDSDQFNIPDYWQNPEETAQHLKGDCEDYAILKKKILIDLGIPSQNIFMVYTKIPRGGKYQAHMVLFANDDSGRTFVLDNLRNQTPDIQEYKKIAKAAVFFLVGDTMLYSSPSEYAEAVQLTAASAPTMALSQK